MASSSIKSCMNATCGVSTSSSAGWRKGWVLRSGDFAILCDNCGSEYEQSVFCEVFHSKDSGWRECTSCGKRLHCGCIASKSLLELLDGGGVNCTSCSKSAGVSSVNGDEKTNGCGISKVDDAGELQSASADNQLTTETKLMQLGNCIDRIATRNLLQLQSSETDGSYRKMKQEDILPPVGEFASTSFSNFNQVSNASSQTAKPEIHRTTAAKDLYESLAQTNLSISLGSSLGNPNPFPGGVVDERVLAKASSPLQQGPRSRHLLPKPPKPALVMDANAGMVSQIRVARPPAEGRGRNQLLPRYWPRITDQELQQISGDPNSTIVPLFEKVLSASDAGRIGRLVLPKACAEAYFPPISQPEGLPLRIQDVKGKEWVFQFRFWPNNNSRMYVLEGVTPCIQSMKLQAGDTVTFSRMDPEGKLVMGFRKASNSIAMQDTQPSAIPNGVPSSESYFSGVFENLPIISGYSGLLHSLKGSTDTHLSVLSKHLHSASGDSSWHKSEKQEARTRDGLLLPSLLAPERKRLRNIGSKSKRLLIDSLDALELKVTWEEAQDLLRPEPSIKPSIVTIEDHDFEEYEEPPVFGKTSIFVVRSIGGQEQWAQCDSCSKWRRLPIDVLLPPKWTCVDNAWDQSRCSCSAPDELAPRELENLLRLNKDFKKRRITGSHRPAQEHESSGLDALANAAILGDAGEQSTTAVAATTKHPRHRPGCSCIVCIQPPSGKGKHKPTCTCNVCMTVKRRFKTLMMRKKKRQSEREAEIAQRIQHMSGPKDEADVESSSKLASTPMDPSDNEARSGNELESKSQTNNLSNKLADSGKGHLDLNCHPGREEDSQAGLARMSMTSLLQVASLPLETYLKQNGLASLSEQQASSASHVPPQAGENGARIDEDCQPASVPQEQDSGGEEDDEPGPDQSQTDLL
ncbi:PREDICTED: B3 domain-containing transcription repressor VAL2-like [Populus euphratica]|uniref:B3 domain-containing transcription repressor VAL2-like n=1 Tax=Populus euphratica TaxID=75702 RepID=A0AAJ6T1M2_POPEU|nr:PREDICTED: B3 domain-containing transcription repressor VAL2-like [Populus euphratica]XP_011002602.1 PREDICTED: B3 domain-containing transcription repressor VAL2-like [Populus euphratica]